MNKLKEILLSKDIEKSINDNIDYILDMIPEIKFSINFPHNHPHHHLDVWKHTMLAMSMSPAQFDIRISLLLHDIGKPFSYQDKDVRHFHNHPKVSAQMSSVILERNNVENKDYIMKIIELHDTAITMQNINENPDFCRDLFIVQYCDALAHNPEKLTNRIKYIKGVLEYFDKYQKSNNRTIDFPENIKAVYEDKSFQNEF